MKSNKDVRGVRNFDSPGGDRRGTKIPPAKKSGKERYELYSELEEEEGLGMSFSKKESVFDYFDDEGDEL